MRRIAAEIGLPNAKKKDSTGICFIGERPFREFLNRYLPHEPGPIKDDAAASSASTSGLSFYTLGQRQGIGIGGVKDDGAQRGGGEHAPWFVARKDIATQHAVRRAGPRPSVAAVAPLARRRRELGRRRGAARRRAMRAKTRYRQADAPCTLRAATRRRASRCDFDAAAMGGDAGPVGRALRRRRLPGRRRHRVVGCRQRNTGATAGPT